MLIIGVHSAKFSAEDNADGILSAIARYSIQHPVIQDLGQKLWRRFGINSWPSFVLIGSDGQAVGRTAGEGRRLLLDAAISSALELGRQKGTLNDSLSPLPLVPQAESMLRFPGKLALDQANQRLFIADSGHHRLLVLELSAANAAGPGTCEARLEYTIGDGQAGFMDGSIYSAQFRNPQGLFCAGSKLYVADTGNHAIRVVDLEAQEVLTLAGNGEQAGWMAGGGFGPATALNSPWDLVETGERLYIAMAGSHQLWQLELSSLQIKPFAGNGREDIVDGPPERAELAQPSGICLGNGRLYFADSESSAIRSAEPGSGRVHTLAGSGLFVWGHRDGALTDARLQHPAGIDFHADLLYVADTYNHAIRIIDLAKEEISTLLAPSQSAACRIDDEQCRQISLFEPGDVKRGLGCLWIADTGNHLVRCLDLAAMQLQTLNIVQSGKE